jgi:3-hydroxybutyryl-CoA dehydrogenase
MNRVAVVGAGTMGHGIAQVAARAGYAVRLTDARPDVLPAALGRIRRNLDGAVERGKATAEDAANTLARITAAPALDDAVADADLVIEAVAEDLEVKRALFGRLAALAPAGAVLATNTSSLSVGRIADAVPHRERVMGMHFFNPVHLARLVELVVHDATDAAVLSAVRVAAERMGKDPIVVRDSPGFASSRLGVLLGLEAMRMVQDGVASPADIDKAMELGYGHPMGPLRVSDLVGLDVRLAIAEYLYRELGGERFQPPEILRRKVAAGEWGKKSGRGFHEWPTNVSF